MATTSPRRLLYGLTALSHLVVFPLAWLAGLAIDFGELAKLYGISLPLACGVVLYAIRQRMEMLRVALDCVMCGLLLTVPVGISTYIAMGADHLLADEALARMDATLGFDWNGLIRFVDARWLLAEALLQAYQSFALQLVLVPILLAVFSQPARAYAMVTSYGVLCFASSLISVWYPALGTYTSYGSTAESLTHINAHFGFAFLEQFHAVRNDPAFVFSMARMMGILTFPSVHAAVAILCAWAMWPIRPLRYPFLLLNILMTVSAVSHAGHYLADIIAGIGIAAATIAIVNKLCLQHQHSEFGGTRIAVV